MWRTRAIELAADLWESLYIIYLILSQKVKQGCCWSARQLRKLLLKERSSLDFCDIEFNTELDYRVTTHWADQPDSPVYHPLANVV